MSNLYDTLCCGAFHLYRHVSVNTRRWNSGLFCRLYTKDNSDVALFLNRYDLERKGTMKR